MPIQTKLKYSTLSIRPSYSYFTLVDKPIQSVPLNSVIQLAAQTLTFPFTQWSCPSEASIILGALAFRLLAELASKFFQELDHRKAYLLHKYYKVSYLIKNFFTSYLGLNLFRACHFILDCQQFNSFNIHTTWVPSLASYDPTFMLPIATMTFSYVWVAKSRHPFMIHLTKPQNFLYRMNIAFMTGLLFVPLPAIYGFGYIGWMSGHLLIRTLEHEGSDLKQQWRNVLGLNQQFITARQKKSIDIQNGKNANDQPDQKQSGNK